MLGLESQPGLRTTTSQLVPKTLRAPVPRNSREGQKHFPRGLIIHMLESWHQPSLPGAHSAMTSQNILVLSLER